MFLEEKCLFAKIVSGKVQPMKRRVHSELTIEQWQDLLDTYAQVPTYPGVYILGCFAKRVTLYSQQVRAFNLVYGLHVTGAINKGRSAAVIGAGAAGVTAAAALACTKWNVTLLEKAQGVLRLQFNSRHRWVHPHIYDWPELEYPDDHAYLPIVNWKADYAANVASRIEKGWKAIQQAEGIDALFSVKGIRLARKKEGKGYKLSWKDQSGAFKQKDIDLLIIAVGFGLDSEKSPSVSYWSGDNVDDAHRSREDERWLISGLGDGALTDLMRSCIDSFRHAAIVGLFETFDGREGLVKDLQDLHSDPSVSDEDLSKRFYKLSTGNMQERLKPLLRQGGPEVFLTGMTPHLYGRGSSILNRLIVLVLSQLGAFTFLPGPSGDPTQVGKRFRVELGYPAGFKEFDRVILRHGTQPCIWECARDLMTEEACEALKEAWDRVSPESDLSRQRLWRPGFFGPEGQAEETINQVEVQVPKDAREQAFDSTVNHFGVKIAHLAFYKELRGDGSSTVTYAVEGLTTLATPVTGVHFYYESVAGKIGYPVLDANADRLGLKWDPDDKEPGETYDVTHKPMEELRKKVRKLSGTVRFKEALKANDPAMRFTLKFIILNGDALTAWEFDQLYELHERVHVNRQSLRSPTEYFARFVWCPVESLRLQLRLPNESLGKPTSSVFAVPPGSQINVDEVVRQSTVQLYPPAGSGWTPEKGEWERLKDAGVAGDVRFNPDASQTWELTVDKPLVGSCYSLDWKLPDSQADAETMLMADQAQLFRAKLLSYHKSRLLGPKSKKKDEIGPIRELFTGLHGELAALQKQASFNEEFDIALMTYDDAYRKLRFVDGTHDGGEPSPDLDDFWLPFGLGLAGASFKAGDPYFYFRDQATAPEYYLTIPGNKAHRGMVAIPAVHPKWYGPAAGNTIEPARMCIGVIDISFEEDPKWLKSLGLATTGAVVQLRDTCQNFCNRLCEYLELW
jgi:hypothetical protein